MNDSVKISRVQPYAAAKGAHQQTASSATSTSEFTRAKNNTTENAAPSQRLTHKGRKSHALAFFIACTTIFFALATPNACKSALLVGYETCVNQLLFALFPFLIAANLLVLCGIAPLLGRPLRPLCRLLGFGEACAAGLFAIALLGGFAPAISALAQSVQAGQMSKTQAGKLLVLLSFLGPSYIVLAVGAGMLGSLQTGVYLFISQVLASVFATLLLHLWDVGKGADKSSKGKNDTAQTDILNSKLTSKNRYKQTNTTTSTHHKPLIQANAQPKCAIESVTTHADTTHPKTQAQSAAQPNTPADFTLSTVIGDSFFAFLRLCSVILYLQFLCAGVCALLPAQYHWLCQMALEVTAACGGIAAAGYAATFRCCAALSVLSGSILLQIAALCPAHKGISCKRLLLSRLLHLPLALLFFRLFLFIPQTQAVYSSLNERVIGMQRLPLDQAVLLFLALIFLADRLRKPLQRR